MHLAVVPKPVTYPIHAADAIGLAHHRVLIDRELGDLEEPRFGRRWRALDVDHPGELQARGLVRVDDDLPGIQESGAKPSYSGWYTKPLRCPRRPRGSLSAALALIGEKPDCLHTTLPRCA